HDRDPGQRLAERAHRGVRRRIETSKRGKERERVGRRVEREPPREVDLITLARGEELVYPSNERRVLGRSEARGTRAEVDRSRVDGWELIRDAHVVEPDEGEVGETEVVVDAGFDALYGAPGVVRDEPDPDPVALDLLERREGLRTAGRDDAGRLLADDPSVAVAHDRVALSRIHG